MSYSLKIRIGIVFFFILLIFFHLLPLSLHPFDALNDTEDCVLNTWIPVWVQQQLFKDPLNLFDTNTFYPHSNTLSYSEHLFPQALFSLPVKLLTNNPIAVYNFIFFFSFFLNAYGMFLLTRHLTKNDFIGILCGIIFAFNTYQINQITHLQLLSSGLIPLTFLYLHKYIEEHNLKNSILFAAFFLYKKRHMFSSPPRALKSVFRIFLLVDLIAILVNLLTGGVSINLGILTVNFTNLTNQVLVLLFLVSVYTLLSIGIFLFKNRWEKSKENTSLILYVVIGIWTLLLSFGSQFTFLGKSTGVIPLPFRLFFNYVPGFKGIRVPSRYAVFVIFCIAVLAAYGLKYFFQRWEIFFSSNSRNLSAPPGSLFTSEISRSIMP